MLVPQAGAGICTTVVLFNIEVNIISEGKIVEDGFNRCNVIWSFPWKRSFQDITTTFCRKMLRLL